MRFELMTSSLPRRRSTPELRGPNSKDEVGRRKAEDRSFPSLSSFRLHPSALLFGAGDEIRTRDPQLGRLMLYQLSYTRPQSLPIANFQLPIDRHSVQTIPIGNGQSKIGNRLVQGVGFEPT